MEEIKKIGVYNNDATDKKQIIVSMMENVPEETRFIVISEDKDAFALDVPTLRKLIKIAAKENLI